MRRLNHVPGFRSCSASFQPRPHNLLTASNWQEADSEASYACGTPVQEPVPPCGRPKRADALSAGAAATDRLFRAAIRVCVIRIASALFRHSAVALIRPTSFSTTRFTFARRCEPVFGVRSVFAYGIPFSTSPEQRVISSSP